MKHKKQQYIPTLQPGTVDTFLAPNRKTRRVLKKLGKKMIEVNVVTQAESKNKEFKLFRKELARKHGSTTGELKKKHLNRERLEQAVNNLTNGLEIE
jgi:arginyl-tRNA--protein-N-Asp/Glu arginylyltransferase